MRQEASGTYSYVIRIIDQTELEWVSRDFLVDNYPILLMEFYEKHIVFGYQNVGNP